SQRRRRAAALDSLSQRAAEAREASPLVADLASRRSDEDRPAGGDPLPPTDPAPQPPSGGGDSGGGQGSDETEQAKVLKAKFDALGVAIRAGVDPQSAATMLGLEGIKFTGAVPVSLRMPKDEVEQRDLEEE